MNNSIHGFQRAQSCWLPALWKTAKTSQLQNSQGTHEAKKEVKPKASGALHARLMRCIASGSGPLCHQLGRVWGEAPRNPTKCRGMNFTFFWSGYQTDPMICRFFWNDVEDPWGLRWSQLKSSSLRQGLSWLPDGHGLALVAWTRSWEIARWVFRAPLVVFCWFKLWVYCNLPRHAKINRCNFGGDTTLHVRLGVLGVLIKLVWLFPNSLESLRSCQ